MKSFLSRAFKGGAKAATAGQEHHKETSEEESARLLEQALPSFVVSELENRLHACSESQ